MTSSSNPNRASSSTYRSLLRVLCLHDNQSNSLDLSTKLNSLGEKLYRNHGIDLVFVDAPLIVEPSEEDDYVGEDGDQNGAEIPRRINSLEYHPPRVWWEEDKGSCSQVSGTDEEEEEIWKDDDEKSDRIGTNDSNKVSQETNNATSPDDHQHTRYVGLDASLLLLRQVWSSSPFWGILAVGQAAGVAALLPLLPRQGKEGQPPSFVIFVNGKTLLDEEELLTEHLDLPCLHIVDPAAMGEGHGNSNPAAVSRSNATQRLIRQYGGTIVCDESGSWSTPSSPSSSRSIKTSSRTFNNHVGRFLVAQKRHLRKTFGDAMILALRHEIHRTEADAAQLVAKHIAKNPPDALMAVITPRDVGGFRDKRRGPGEEGGGAPCPSEFLLHRAKRSGKSKKGNRDFGSENESFPQTSTPQESYSGEDASRHHPNQQRRAGG